MPKNIELSILNETTILVKDATVKNRFNNKQFGDVYSEPVYFQDLDDKSYIVFVTGFTPPRNENTKISIQSSLDMNLKSSDVKLDWLLNKEDLPLYLESIKQSSILLSKNFWIYNTNDGDEYR